MESLNFDEGYKELAINGDKNRVLRFNPLDPMLIVKLENLENNINKILADNSLPVETIEKKTMEQFDLMLGEKSGEIIFGNNSPIAIVNDKYLFQVFLEQAFIPYIESEMKSSEAKMKKYLEGIGNDRDITENT